MKNSPTINFKRVNENVATTTPSLGVSHFMARTTKGPFNDPSVVINSVNQFRDLFGREIVPDNTISNIERALSTGSKVRVSRVAGSTPVSKGTAKVYDTEAGTAGSSDAAIELKIVNPFVSNETITVNMKIQTKEAGSSIVNPNLPGGDNNFYLQLSKTVNNTVTNYKLEAYSNLTDGIIDGTDLPGDNLISSDIVLRASSGVNSFTDYEAFADFYYNNPNIEFEVVNVVTDIAGINIVTVEDLIAVMRIYKSWQSSIIMSEDNIFYLINEGSSGGNSSTEKWMEAYQALKGYTDGYQLIPSHLHQHLTTDYEATYAALAKDVNEQGEIILYVEIPKSDSNGIMDYTRTLSKIKTVVAAVGNYPFVAFFGGGVKLYDRNGALRNNDVLGTVAGLGDEAAVNYGPWMSFAGMNRGVLSDGQGNTITDGKALSYQQLNDLANNSMNLFITQDTPTMGKRTMLWHNFTGSVANSSDRFLSSMRAYLYLKKNIRPILQKYIEEQNTFSTWRNIYEEAQGILQPLVGEIYTSYDWQGDQFATSFEALQVNNENDVRQGKYKIILSYVDIVTLQEISMEFYIEKANSTITINQ